MSEGSRFTPEHSESLESPEHHDPLLRHLTEWTRQVSEQPRERVAMGIAAAARGFHAQLKALPTSTRIVQSESEGRKLVMWEQCSRHKGMPIECTATVYTATCTVCPNCEKEKK